MNKKKYNKYLYIPVEIYRRELNGMLILAITAAQSGWSVLLGGKRAIMPYLNKLPEGIVLVKSVVPGEYANLKKIKNEGHKITSLDAEGLILTQGPTGATERYSEQTIELADALFFWGKRQLRVAKYDFPSIQKRAHVTGSPIFDFWRYRKFFPAHTKKKLEKKCILIATSFSYPNHTISEEMAKKLLLDCIPKVSSTQSHLDLFFKTANLQRLVFPQFKKMVEGLFKSCPDINFILRPHVAEKHLPWIEIGNKFKNVEMSLSGEISSLISKCDAIVHFNSTTAIEAYYFEKPALTFYPDTGISEELLAMLSPESMSISHKCHSLEQIVSAIKNLDSIKTAHLEKDLCDFLETADSTTINCASKNIVSILDKLDIPIPKRGFPSLVNLLINRKMFISELKLRVLCLVGWLDNLTGLFGKRYAPYKDIFKYGSTKQGRLNTKEVLCLFNKIIHDMNLQDQNIYIKPIKNGMFLLNKKV